MGEVLQCGGSVWSVNWVMVEVMDVLEEMQEAL
jgi:hypothetical protein